MRQKSVRQILETFGLGVGMASASFGCTTETSVSNPPIVPDGASNVVTITNPPLVALKDAAADPKDAAADGPAKGIGPIIVTNPPFTPPPDSGTSRDTAVETPLRRAIDAPDELPTRVIVDNPPFVVPRDAGVNGPG